MKISNRWEEFVIVIAAVVVFFLLSLFFYCLLLSFLVTLAWFTVHAPNRRTNTYFAVGKNITWFYSPIGDAVIKNITWFYSSSGDAVI